MRRVRTASRRSRRQGFSLLEVTIAMAILGLGLLALAAMQLHAMRGGSSSRRATEAAALAQTRMERFQRGAWADVAPTGGWSAVTAESAPGQGVNEYDVSWRISDVVADWTRAIDVRVAWDEPGRAGRTVTISSMRFNREGL